uniref:CDGSH iron-sulfur domain-containing protein 2 n=1 Tax=Equus caballus TaxID=9796 RepID=F6W079_HORSE
MVLESVARIVKVQLPAYLKRLPVPESISGFARLTVSEWLRLLPFLGVLALLGYLAVRPFLPKKKQQKDSLINLKIQKENPKVVNEINIEDLCLTKAAYCRCWRSKTLWHVGCRLSMAGRAVPCLRPGFEPAKPWAAEAEHANLTTQPWAGPMGDF